jgi:hypothetical protein
MPWLLTRVRLQQFECLLRACAGNLSAPVMLLMSTPCSCAMTTGMHPDWCVHPAGVDHDSRKLTSLMPLVRSYALIHCQQLSDLPTSLHATGFLGISKCLLLHNVHVILRCRRNLPWSVQPYCQQQQLVCRMLARTVLSRVQAAVHHQPRQTAA